SRLRNVEWTGKATDVMSPQPASPAVATRRLFSPMIRYRSCHSVGPLDGDTCTAVTLYSGQFVAQSELSVVTTFTWHSGWWKVVYTTPGATRSVIFARSVVSPARLCTRTQSSSRTPRISAS